MFETKTFENILSEMLSYVSDRYPDIDIREGSIIYTALAPAALELETAYHEMNMIIEETFLETASKEYLVKHGNQIGVEINEATFGHFKGEFDVNVEIGSRFNLDKFNYAVINKISDPNQDYPYHVFELVCETEGSEPNSYLGDLTPISYVENLSYAKLTSVIVFGEDEEETEPYRYRLQVHVKNPPINGNISQYNEWLDEYDGIGKYKVLPCWNGVNTVKLVILNSENKQANSEFIKEVQDYFDPPTATINDTVTNSSYPQGRGMGNGKALIGSIVTIDTVTETPVLIDCRVTLNDGYSSPVGVKEAIIEHFESIALVDAKVDYLPIWSTIFSVDSVKTIDYLKVTVKNTVMNSASSPFIDSVTLVGNEIAVLDENSVWSV